MGKGRIAARSAKSKTESADCRRIFEELRASERRFRDVVEGSIQGILIQRDFVPIFANRACADMLGYATPQDVTAAASLDQLLAPDECARVRRFADERMRGKDVPARYELRARRKDGSLFWIELCPRVIEWDGEPAILVSMVDIDERKRAEAELRETQANLERLVDERTRELAEEVAARRRIEESLKESQEKYRHLVDHMEDGVFLVKDGRISFANRGMANLLGYDTIEAILGRPYPEFVVPALREMTAALHERRVAGESVDTRYEVDLLHRDGHAVPVLLNLVLVETPDGRPAILGTAKDIAERKRVETALKESEERFKALFDHSPQSLNLKDAKGRYLLVNPAWERQHASSRAEALGKTSIEVFGPENGEHLTGIENEVLATGKTQSFEVTVQLSDGRRQTRFITKFPIRDGEGRISGVGTVGADISEAKRMEMALRDSEEQLRTLLANSPILIHVKDTEGRYLLINPEFERIHKLTASDVIGRTARELFPEDSAAAIDAADKETLATGQTASFEVNFRTPDGTLRTHLGTKFAIRDSSGAIVRLGTFGIDITERKAMEKALRESEEQFRAILDNAPAAINLKDAEGHFLAVNQGFVRNRGFAEADILGKTSGDLFGAEFGAKIRSHEEEVLATGEARSFELDVTLPGGEPRTLFITKFPIRDGDGTITRLGSIDLDITERKQVADALRISERRFRALMDHGNAAITLKDGEGRYLMVNREFERCFKVSADQAVGKTARDLLPRDIAEGAEERERLVRETGKPVTGEMTYQDVATRQLVTRHVVAFPIHDDGTASTQIGTFSLDVTERKRAEQSLKASEEWFRDFAESSSDWLWESDPEGRLTYLSERVGALLDIEPTSLLGKRRQDFGAPGQEAEWRKMEEMIRNRQPIRDFRYVLLGRGGKPMWLKISGRPRFSPTGAFLGYRGTGTNVTGEAEARQREAQVTERFLKAIENVAVAMALFDHQDRLVIANRIYRSQLVTTAHLRPGVTFEEMLRAEADAGAYLDSLGNKEEWIRDRLARHRNPSGSFELAKSNGLILQIREYLAPDGFTLMVAHDITASKRAELDLISARDELEIRVRERTQALEQEILERQYAEQALQDANVELERRVEERTRHLSDEIAERKKFEAQFLQAQKMEAVGQLAGGIAHDFNNLLTVIQGNLSWLNDVVKGDARTSRMLGMALEAARRAGQLTHRMLAFSRRQELRPVAVDLRKSLDGMEPLISRALSEAVKLNIELPESHWPVMVDSHQLESAILNIALNARDAMPTGGTFTLRVENRTVGAVQAAEHDGIEPGDYVLLSLIDTGTGMPSEVLERVFDPFFTTKEVGRGSGLGLSMVFGFVNQSGGFIEISSAVGRGTRVEIYLPRSSDGKVATSADGQDGPVEIPSEMKILVVEDDPLVRGVAVEYLKMAGITALQANDGQAAVAILEKGEAVDLLLTDVVMPGGMSGLDLAEVVRGRWPKTAILFMSGYSYDEFARHGADPDTIGLLRKPFTKRELLNKVLETMGQHRGDGDGSGGGPIESAN